MTVLSIQVLHEKVAQSELGGVWMNDPLMEQDTWSFIDLGYSAEECSIRTTQNIYFNRISLPWLKYLTKLTIKARVRAQHSMDKIGHDIVCLTHLDQFLVANGYTQPFGITNALLHEFAAVSNAAARQSALAFAIQLWADEGWLELPFTPKWHARATPSVKTIPEEVLYQIYENLHHFPLMLERLLRVQLALGCRMYEALTMPRQCLKQEGEKWFLLRWIAKRKFWRFEQVHFLVAELVQEQQRFLNTEFGANSTFDKLFCKLSRAAKDGAAQGRRFGHEPVYLPEYLSTNVMFYWIREFSEIADLKDKYGNRFNLTSHQLRRTKASVMAYCDAEDEYIAAVLGHGSLDMLPHYRQRSLERLEKDSQAKGYVDMYGQVTIHKPKKQRYEKLSDLLKVSTPLGECHRPTMLGDCQKRYACLSCPHHRVTSADRPRLIEDHQHLQQDLAQAQTQGQERRVTEIERLLELMNNRLKGLDEEQAIRARGTDEETGSAA